MPNITETEVLAEFVAPETGAHYEIFGPSHAEEVAATAGAPVIARLPIDPEVAMLCDAGKVGDTAPNGCPGCPFDCACHGLALWR